MKKAEITSLSALVDDLEALKSGPPDASEFAHILDELEAQIYVIDPDSLHYDFINKTALKTVGWAGVDYTNLTPADDDPYFNADQFRHMTARLLNGEQKEVKFYRSLHDMPETEVRIRLTHTSQGIPKLLVVVRPPPSLADHRAMIAPVTELSPIATTVVRGDTGKIIYANQKFRHKFSLPYASLEDQNISDVFEHLNPVELRQISTLLKQSAAGNVSFEVTTSDGQHFELKISHVVLFAGRSDLAIIVQNISERVEREAERHAFLATISHELKTPLAAIIGTLSTILDGGLMENQTVARLTELAKTNADRLATLVDQILAKETAELNVHRPTMTDWNDFVLESVLLNRQHAAKSGVELRFLPGPGAPQVALDRPNFGRVLDNLITNAIRHGGTPGKVTVTADVKGGNALLQVRDEGAGIRPENLSEVFDWHFVGDASDSRRVGGTGLGLAICRKIVMTHGGTIYARNRAKGGACFEVILPLGEPEQP